MYLDEYVGPSRSGWSKDLIQGASEVFERLPATVRRSRRLKLPIDWRDPTEAVRSAEILDAVTRHFVITQRRDYGGNFLSVIYPHLDLSSLAADARATLLQSVIDAEREHLAVGHASYYTVLMAMPR